VTQVAGEQIIEPLIDAEIGPIPRFSQMRLFVDSHSDHRDDRDVIHLPETEGGFGDGICGARAQAGGALETEKFAVIGRFWDSIRKEREAIALHKLKVLLRKPHIGVQSKRQLGWDYEFFAIMVGREVTGVGQG
jgi:hypothetical protein